MRTREQAHEEVEALLQSMNAPERLQGLMKATRAKDPRHLARLLEILQTDGEPKLREQAAMALDELRDLRTKDGFLNALEDSAWDVRSRAGWGLVHLGHAVREDVLRLEKTSKSPEAREMARLVLERLIPKGTEVLLEEAELALTRVFWVNQGVNYEKEREGATFPPVSG